MFTNLLFILMTAVLVNNYVLSQFMGVCSFLGVTKKLDSSVGMSCAVTFVMVMATAVTWPIYHFVLEPNGLAYLQTLVFIFVIALFVQLIEIFLKKYVVGLYRSLGVYLALITTNCAVLGVTILNIDNQYSFVEALVSALGAGLGYFAAMVLFSGIRQKIDAADIPETFKGVPATLMAAGILSMSFLGFGGIAESIFGK